MNCVIIAGGRLDTSRAGGRLDTSRPWYLQIQDLLKTADLVIAADSGASHLKKSGYLPHVIIGDLDSIDPDTLAFFQKNQVPVQAHPSRKNSTDTELCLEYARAKGATRITLLAATGNRLDHTLANILLLLPLADAGISARILDEKNEVQVVTDRVELTGAPGDLVSLIPITPTVRGVTLKGLSYPLENHTLVMGNTLGISNVLSGSTAQISIRSGTLLVVRSRD